MPAILLCQIGQALPSFTLIRVAHILCPHVLKTTNKNTVQYSAIQQFILESKFKIFLTVSMLCLNLFSPKQPDSGEVKTARDVV